MTPDLEIVISFDDTGSMYSVRQLVRSKINHTVAEIKKHVPTARIGIIIHNDYCDEDTIQMLQLTDDMDKVIAFVNKSSSGGGGDSDECYELALNYMHEKFDWQSDKRIGLLIGDCEPHKKGYSVGKGDYWSRGKSAQTVVCVHDWKEELGKCKSKGIQVYPIQALNHYGAAKFYSSIANITGTVKLDLMQFQHIESYILGIFHKQNNTLEQFENSQPIFKSNFTLKGMFDKLFDRASTTSTTKVGDVDSMWKYQVMEVPSDISIKHFVEGNSLAFKTGLGFYQITKPETVQDHKKIIMMKRDTDEVIMDTEKCRSMLGIPYEKCKFNPRNTSLSTEYDIYIQSTSYNRKLIGGTKFLYELDVK